MHGTVGPPAEARLRSETIDLLANRASVRKFQSVPVGVDMVEAVLRAGFRAPTSSNIQAYSVVVVRDAETKRRLSVVAGNQKWVAETPVFLGFCADLTRIAAALEANGHSLAGNNMEVGLVSSIDAALVAMSAYLAAESLGLGGVCIGGVRNNAVEVAQILGLPHRVYCVFGLCLGWPAEAPLQKPRMAYGAMVHHERYGALAGGLDPATALAGYDTTLAAHYTETGRKTTPDSWTHDMDKKFNPPLRDRLREELKQLGFDFR